MAHHTSSRSGGHIRAGVIVELREKSFTAAKSLLERRHQRDQSGRYPNTKNPSWFSRDPTGT